MKTQRTSLLRTAFRLATLLLPFLIGQQASAQCTNFSPFGSATAPSSGTINVTTCQFGGEYSTISGVAATTTYTTTGSSGADYFTIRQGTPAGPVVGMGFSPLNWTSTAAGTYYMHLNTSAAPTCGTDFSCHNIDLSVLCTSPAPTAVTATPATICAGQVTQLRAVSAGFTIRWYTTPTGGLPIGTSASGANFPVSPGSSITYYAAVFNGSCDGVRVPVAVTVNPTPVVTSVLASPDTICLGNSAAFSANGCGIVSGFTSTYAPASWATTHVPVTDMGSVNTGGAPASISITSSDAGNLGVHRVFWTITVPCSGTISFNWNYATTDIDGCHYDQPEYAINGVVMGTLPGWVDYGANVQSGSCAIPITAGQTFSLVMSALDDILGPATTVFTNFVAPGGSGGLMDWYTLPLGGTFLGTTASGAPYSVTPPVSGTVTVWVSTTVGGCTSARVPVVLFVDPCILPAGWASFWGEKQQGAHHLRWNAGELATAASFEVERSADGHQFSPIGSVYAESQDKDSPYRLTDRNPLDGANYYRLKVVDLNGEVDHSNVVLLHHGSSAPELSCYPNPAGDNFQFSLEGFPSADVEVALLDLTGREVLRERLTTSPSGTGTMASLKGLPAGHYLVEVKPLGAQRSYRSSILHVE